MVETEKRLSKGTFKKCDMHLHSSSCYSRSYGKKDFFNALIQSDLDVIAVTDHNIVDDRLLSELQTALSDQGKTLIGGVELNVKLKEETIKRYHLTTGKGPKGEYFHAIVWFSMEHAPVMKEVVAHLFNQRLLEKKKERGIEESSELQTAKALSLMTEGTAIYLEDFQKEAAAIPHFFIPHENKDRSLSSYLPNKYRENLAYKDRLFYYSHAMAVEGGSKSRKSISNGMANELRTTVAALLFSDAQAIGEIGSRFTWIDFDSDLDSLLLAISDPESRIKTSDEYPDLPQTNTGSFLESVTFNTCVDGNEEAGRSVTLEFSPGYNGIVGSRGSGKTMLACLLASRGGDTYSKFVDTDSVKFKMHGGILTGNRPECLYLGQGELEEIYRSGKYESIPFLGERVAPLKDRAGTESAQASQRLNEVLDLVKRLLTTFCDKYNTGALRIDHLDTETPSGVTIEKPTIPAGDVRQIEKAKKAFKELTHDLAIRSETLGAVEFKASYHENSTLFDALNVEASSIREELAVVMEHAERFSSALEAIDPSWFACRDRLLHLFSAILEQYNNASGSTSLTQYRQQTKRAAIFLDELLSLRLALKHLDQEARAAYEKLHKPIEPVVLHNGDEPIEITLTYEDDSSYSDKLANLLGAASSKDNQALVEAFLYQYNKSRMHKVFDGRKFKSCSTKDLAAHYDKFFDLAKDSMCAAGGLSTRVKIANEPIDSMSPGMKAQALLKLFLNDGIASGRWSYVIIDQPEDNLDVATIKDFLINRLKQLKLNVQFFVVSHSAPVIVNGDARTVIVCSNDGSEIDYASGTMNESSIKQSIADVLDGGERYLKMRLNKYNFQVGDSL